MKSFHSDRTLALAAFLERHDCGASDPAPLPADFSPRRYARVRRSSDDISLVVMDADKDQKTEEFVALARLLCQIGLHTPAIIADHAPQGLVLMEDLAGETFGTLLDRGAEPTPLYQRGLQVLVTLHQKFSVAMIAPPFPVLPRFDAALFATQAQLYLDEYWLSPFGGGQESAVSEDDRAAFHAAWCAALRPVEALPQSLLLRDYMPDNLIACADGTTGVLDFQDAGIGPIAYDLASLCEVVRRDGGWEQLPALLDAYMKAASPACDREALMQGCIILSAQRHMRILGILARQIAKGNDAKRVMVPRVRAHLDNLLSHDALTPVREWLEAARLH